MLIELSKPIALVMCLLSLCALFNAAFLHPASGMEQRMWDCLLLLSLAAGVSLSSGMIFRESIENGIEPILSTLPVQLFCWAAGTMALLFIASLYLEANGIFYRDVRPL